MSESEKPIDIEDEGRFMEWFTYGLKEIEQSLKNHALFEKYLRDKEGAAE